MEINQKGNASQNNGQPQVAPSRPTATPITASGPVVMPASVHVQAVNRTSSSNPIMAPGSALAQKSAPELPRTPGVNAEESNMMKQGVSADKKGKSTTICMVLLGILAVGGIAFGAWEFYSAGQQKEEFTSKIDELERQKGEMENHINELVDASTINAGERTTNPVIMSGGEADSLNVTFNSTPIGSNGESLHIDVKDGTISSCEIINNENASPCAISGLSGEIYKVIEFGAGQDKTTNNVGFIMSDGAVQYLPLADIINGNDGATPKKLNLGGFVVDAIGIQVSEASSGHFSTIFVLKDGSTVQFDESML